MRSAQFRMALDAACAVTGRSVFTKAEVARALLPEDSPRAVEKTLAAAVRDKLLVHVCRGLYAYRYGRQLGRPIREEIVLRLRSRSFTYVSLETALSAWGVIDQEPLGAITVMSTGRSGRIATPYGLILMTHTARPVAELMADIVMPDPLQNWLPCAKPRLAARDLMRVGRNTDLIEWDEIPHAEREMSA